MHGERVVDRSAHAACFAMAKQSEEAVRLCVGDELRVEVGFRRLEAHVEMRAAPLLRGPRVEAARVVDRVPNEVCLVGVVLGDGCRAADLQRPFRHQTHHAHRERRWRIEARSRVGVVFKAQNRRQFRRRARDEVLARDDQARARRAEVLLSGREHHRVLREVPRSREDVARRVADERQRCFRWRPEGRSLDGVVLAIEEVFRAGGLGEFALLGDARVLDRAAVESDRDVAAARGFGVGLVRPDRGVDVGRRFTFADEVQRQKAELDGRAAGHEEHGVVATHTRGLAACGFGFVVERLVERAAVGEFEESDAAAAAIDEFFADLLEHALRHASWARAEVVDAPLGGGLREERGSGGGRLDGSGESHVVRILPLQSCATGGTASVAPMPLRSRLRGRVEGRPMCPKMPQEAGDLRVGGFRRVSGRRRPQRKACRGCSPLLLR